MAPKGMHGSWWSRSSMASRIFLKWARYVAYGVTSGLLCGVEGVIPRADEALRVVVVVVAPAATVADDLRLLVLLSGLSPARSVVIRVVAIP